MATETIELETCAAGSFALRDRIEPGTVTPAHQHSRHQLLYAASGTLVLEISDAQWWLPPQRAACIPAEVEHLVRCAAGAELCTAYLDPALCTDLVCGVFSVLPLAREMLLFSLRWGPHRMPGDDVADSYFSTLAMLANEWVECDIGLRLPIPASEELRRAFDYLLAHLDTWTLSSAASAARVSERTLSRRFHDETGITVRNFIRTARVLKAMEQLTLPGSSVTQVAFSVGFEDVSALSRAFGSLVGERPSEFQKRMSKRSQTG